MYDAPVTRLRSLDPHGNDCVGCAGARSCWREESGATVESAGFRFPARRGSQLEDGVTLFHAGERASAVYMVVSGCLMLRESNMHGTERVVGFRLPGELVGMDSWIRGEYSYSARAAGMVGICHLHLPRAGSGSTARPLLERLLRKCALQMERNAPPWPGLPAIERVAKFIEDFAARARVNGSASSPVKLPMTRADIGSYLGLAEETVVRALTQLRKRRLLRVRGKTLELCALAGTP